MKHFVAVLALCLLSITAAHAQQPSTPSPAAGQPSALTSDADQPATTADIDRFFDVMHIRDMMKTSAETMSKSMRTLLQGQIQGNHDLSPEDEDQANKFSDHLLSEMPVEEMVDAMRPVYAKHFTHGDIDALVAFYSSPTGKKVLAEMPAMSQEGMQAAMPVMQKFIARVQQEVQDRIAEMQKQAKQKSTISN